MKKTIDYKKINSDRIRAMRIKYLSKDEIKREELKDLLRMKSTTKLS